MLTQGWERQQLAASVTATTDHVSEEDSQFLGIQGAHDAGFHVSKRLRKNRRPGHAWLCRYARHLVAVVPGTHPERTDQRQGGLEGIVGSGRQCMERKDT